MALFKLLHIFSVVVWVGGMFFAYMVLRPVAADVLHAPERLRLWDKVFSCFFNWVWLALLLLLVSGFYMIYLSGGMAHVPRHVHAMLLLGILMMIIFVHVFFSYYVRFNLLIAQQDWLKAGTVLATIRKLVAVNLLLGMLTIAVAIISKG